mmetsp:Transcript_15754/g.26019  ORF Transcript_15754/g.26019 Transcript_15754/m.26019 type:complete len:187 (-) Transcript_15754:20-580(-)
MDLFQIFETQLSSDEWEAVKLDAEDCGRPLRPGEPPGYNAFQRFWSAKEAFVKARGDGLGFEPLSRAEFAFRALPSARREGPVVYVASVKVDGVAAPAWNFFQHTLFEHTLAGDHWITVARGPTSDIVDANGDFLRTMKRPTSLFTSDEWIAELEQPNPEFEELPVAFLVPEDARPAYAESIVEQH